MLCEPCGSAREPSEHVYYSMTKGLCASCKQSVDAKILFKDDNVYFDKYCPDHGHERVLVASSVAWYLDALSFIAPSSPPKGDLKRVQAGCPNDCGPCQQHQQKTVMPVLPIVSECNLDCPICYTVNKNEDAFVLSKEGFRDILSHLSGDNESIDIINFTGGEPTLHPELPELVRMAHQAGFHRVAISTNGLRLKDEELLKELAACDTRVVLSLDTFDPEIDKKLLGANTVKRKLEVVDLLEKYDVTTTILPAVASGLNDADVPRLLELVLSRPNMVSLELHTLTFTGQGGIGFDRTARTTVPDLHRIMEAATDGAIAPRDFVPSPLAHPHCYSICYVLMLDGGGFVPFARFMSRSTLFDLLSDSLYIQPRERVEEALRDSLDQLWSSAEPVPHADAVMKTLKRMLDEMFPSTGISLEARRRIAERSSKAIYIHSHMDAENFDVARVMRCPIGVPETDGSNVPVCSYNVLYREKDARFTSLETLDRMHLIRPDSLVRREPAKETLR